MHGQIRIIGGQWRGRRITVIDSPDLRPTPDRVRETLFNWLQQLIYGSYCLDMFSGTGALGFEALSRGAKHVVMVDHDAGIVDQLRKQSQELQCENAVIYQAGLPKQLRKPEHRFDIVFLDPPYKSDLLAHSCTYLEDSGFLADEALIYLESNAAISPDSLPPNWEIIRSKKAGDVAYHLVKRTSL